MDFPSATKIVYGRIHSVEPDLVSKIIGYILLQGNGENDMIRYAFGPDQLIHSIIAKAKLDLSSVPAPISPTSLNSAPSSDVSVHFTHFPPGLSRPFSSPANLHVAAPYWDPPLVMDQQFHNIDFVPPHFSEDYRFYNHPQFLTLEEQLEVVNPNGNEYYPELTLGNIGCRSSRRSPSLPEFPLKLCHYYLRGWCKHGDNCRYFHGHPISDSISPVFSPNSNDLVNEDPFLPGSLEKLELELTELLRSRRGCPVSIASLPLMYQEKYGRTLQAEGYLTESQRHGKAGYSLTKLLARLKNSIRLIDRPHGQHAVVLAEDAPKFMEYRNERTDPGGIVAGSRQIYLTFPAESTFTEEDVSNYFRNFGPVQDVRIPCQQKRMFGFVTFLYSETVKMILTKGNPHFVCGARVLVKPYREKSRIVDRKYTEKGESSMYYPSPYFDMEPEMQPNSRLCDTSRLTRKQFMEEHGQVLELETKRLAELQLAQGLPSHQSYYGCPIDDLKASEGHMNHSEADRFSYWFDVLHNRSTSDEKGRLSSTNNYSEHESSQGLNLPESPFASPIASSVSTVI